MLCIKDNGGNKELRGHLEAIFNREYAKKEKSEAITRYLCEKGHGRIDETRLETLPASLIDERIENPHQGINGSFIEKDPAIRNKGSVDIFSGSFNFQTVNP